MVVILDVGKTVIFNHIFRYILFLLTARSLQAALFELRPDKTLARQTLTRLRQGYAAAGRTQIFCLRDQPSRKASVRHACGGKNSNRFAILSMLVPERHVAFAWAGVSCRSLRATSDCPGKKSLLSAHVCGKNFYCSTQPTGINCLCL